MVKIRALVRVIPSNEEETEEIEDIQVVDEVVVVDYNEIIDLNISAKRSNGEFIMWTGKVIGDVLADILDIPEWEHIEERTLNIIPGET